MADDFGRVLDRNEIHDVILGYSRSLDRKDWQGVMAAFHEDATDDHGEYQGDIPGMIDWIASRHAAIEQSMHFIGNMAVEFLDDGRALVETYYQAHFTLRDDAHQARTLWLNNADGAGAKLVVLGRYIDIFAKRPKWRIAERTNIYESVLALEQQPTSRNPCNHWSRRDQDDMYFKIRNRLAASAP